MIIWSIGEIIIEPISNSNAWGVWAVLVGVEDTIVVGSVSPDCRIGVAGIFVCCISLNCSGVFVDTADVAVSGGNIVAVSGDLPQPAATKKSKLVVINKRAERFMTGFPNIQKENSGEKESRQKIEVTFGFEKSSI